jgi:hypothetical protein
VGIRDVAPRQSLTVRLATPIRWIASMRFRQYRIQLLVTACAEDATLQRDVQALLDQPVSTGGFMDFVGGSPAATVPSTAFLKDAGSIAG